MRSREPHQLYTTIVQAVSTIPILIQMTKPKSAFNFDRTIAGFNITENGIKSFTKIIQLGPLQLTFNTRESGVHASIALPGTGLSKRNIKIL